ncbi:MAG TPA: NAD-dependent epimerase/dehydratase family protein [Cytophagaceae bacterium]|nr:NAD-dependent epimerase/dehydratase family protein [Cytophagaceae bacterium]
MIFLTGCNGLIGSFIARELLSKNYQIKALKRPASDMSLISDVYDKIEWVEGDLSDIQLLDKYLEGIDTIIHCAAMISFSSSHKHAMFRSNVEGTANMVNSALRNNIKRFCYISSVAALGRKKDTELIDETSVWEESSNNTYYAYTKYLAELEVWRGIEEGLNTFILNPSIVIGPGNWSKGSSRLFKYLYDEKLFYPKGEMNFIDVRDVSGIACDLLYSDIRGERFILNSGKMSYKDVFFLIADRFKKKRPRYQANTAMSEIAWRLDKLRSFFTGKEALLTRETARSARLHYTYNAEKIMKISGIKFRESKETINWTCNELINRYSRS